MSGPAWAELFPDRCHRSPQAVSLHTPRPQLYSEARAGDLEGAFAHGRYHRGISVAERLIYVGDVAPRLAFRMREDRLTRSFPRSGQCLAGGISVAERRELRATGSSETCPTMIAIVFTALASPSRSAFAIDNGSHTLIG